MVIKNLRRKFPAFNLKHVHVFLTEGTIEILQHYGTAVLTKT